MNYQNLPLSGLFREADRIASKYADESEIEPTDNAAISSYTNNLQRLTDRYGDLLESFTAAEKFDLISILARWQALDTSEQESGGKPVSLREWMVEKLDFRYSSNSVIECCALIDRSDPTDQDILSLIIAISHQLSEGVYSQ